MKLVRCTKNHYFDSEKFKSCPECNKTKNLFPKKQYAFSDNSGGFTKREYYEKSDDNSDESFTRAESISETDKSEKCDDMTVAEISQEYDLYEEEMAEITEVRNKDEKSSFAREVEESSAVVHIDSETEDDSRTVSLYDSDGSEPVVGWLVCIKGIYSGESFNLKSGQNFIGRALNMNVSLSKDMTVSRQYHTSIIFEPEKVQFFVSSGNSSGLTYLNGHLLLTPAQLKPRDIIRIGKGSYMFIPFCDENFSWNTYLGQ